MIINVETLLEPSISNSKITTLWLHFYFKCRSVLGSIRNH